MGAAKRLADTLNVMEFSDVIDIVSKVEDGKYTVLPWLTRVSSGLESVNPYNLSKCCRTETLILPRCLNLSARTLIGLPYITSLTVNSRCNLSSSVFLHLSRLKELQIISDSPDYPDTMLNTESVMSLSGLEYLHVYNNNLVDSDFKNLRSLKGVVIDSSCLTPHIINITSLELCIINGVIYKYNPASVKGADIIRRLGQFRKLKISV